jgi:putative membrane protein
MMDIFAGLAVGLPLLVMHFAVTAVLLLVGVGLHALLTPMKERELVAAGNSAAAVTLSASTIGIALPLAATLATAQTVVDILIWGAIGVAVQVAIFGLARLVSPSMPSRIERGEMATAITLAGWQIAIGLLNAAALVG